jgi:hypothetical protein
METVSQNRGRKNSSFIVDFADKYVRITVESEELMNKPLFRVRFHLQRGKNYMHWQISWNHNSKRGPSYMYVDPKESNIEMYGCKLINKKAAAKRVHAAGKKDVCGWVECESICVIEPEKYPLDNLEQLRYNPIVEPSWRRDEDDGEFDWDNYTFDSLVTDGNKVRVLEEICYA